jgi:hypothetical protein
VTVPHDPEEVREDGPLVFTDPSATSHFRIKALRNALHILGQVRRSVCSAELSVERCAERSFERDTQKNDLTFGWER